MVRSLPISAEFLKLDKVLENVTVCLGTGFVHGNRSLTMDRLLSFTLNDGGCVLLYFDMSILLIVLGTIIYSPNCGFNCDR